MTLTKLLLVWLLGILLNIINIKLFFSILGTKFDFSERLLQLVEASVLHLKKINYTVTAAAFRREDSIVDSCA